MKIIEKNYNLCECAKCVKEFLKKGTVPLSCNKEGKKNSSGDIFLCKLFKLNVRSNKAVYLMINDRIHTRIDNMNSFPDGIEIDIESKYIDKNILLQLMEMDQKEVMHI